MKNTVYINLDKQEPLPKPNAFQGLVTIVKNGRILVEESVLKNIDTFSEEELIYILTNLKPYISPIVTSQYIPSTNTMKILTELAPEFQVQMQLGKMGASPIMPMSPKEYWEGEKIFQNILDGVLPEWNTMQKARYLYQKTGQMLSYDVNVLEYKKYDTIHEKYARNIFTAISKNWGICSAFASIYDYLCYRSGIESMVLSEEEHDYVLLTIDEKDYLADPTMDSVSLKFGMRTQHFGVSKKVFEENGHNLEQTEADQYVISEISPEELQRLDEETGYLQSFGGTYQDEKLQNLVNNLSGNTQTEKTEEFIQRMQNIPFVGRPASYDWEEVLKRALEASEDHEFSQNVKVENYLVEEIKELPRGVRIQTKNPENGIIAVYQFQKDVEKDIDTKTEKRVQTCEEQER